jgi:hypothetical protein
VEGRFLLDVVVGKGTTILKLLASEDEALLIWGNTFLVLDLLLDVFDGVGRLNLEGNGLASQGLDENLHCVCLFVTVEKKKKKSRSFNGLVGSLDWSVNLNGPAKFRVQEISHSFE